MAVYSVHLPVGGASAAADAAFVREGFSGSAFLFGPLFLVWRGFFLAAALWLVAALVVIGLFAAATLSAGAVLFIFFLMHFWLGLEANRLIERRLWRQGYDLAEIVAAPRLEEAEMAFYREIGPSAEAATAAAAAPGPARSAAGVIGSMPEPDRRGAGR
ncbi:hypothetical protein Msil_2553 [Methylocella silvestris BL2]|uniref:DUF2628 domain-containing protein n=1 Tax=Methylocella silvestris (strain DSM 15510 / CIP 108128 / LMG 27833 / NCIMB 13906 / BL2) TaxID=395965 RepID=B8EM88_METSB|nr:DUF2628 domain-containing protein [Methylocella silvestris]ACK51477.1 hypothetical protein Msil_2553 [Methylocella silvestris BL2]